MTVSPVTSVTVPSPLARMTSPASRAARRLDAGADERRLGRSERDGLALHVGAHERAVGVVVLEERDERGGDRHDLLRRHVHVVDLVRVDVARPRRDRRARARVSSRNRPLSSMTAFAWAMT